MPKYDLLQGTYVCNLGSAKSRAWGSCSLLQFMCLYFIREPILGSRGETKRVKLQKEKKYKIVLLKLLLLSATECCIYGTWPPRNYLYKMSSRTPLGTVRG